MKKIISVVLAALMLFSVMAVSVSAVGVCSCGIPEDQHDNNCLCCVYCPGIPQGRIVSCAKKVGDEYTFCCVDCRGFIDATGKCGCSAACACCVLNDDGTIGGTIGDGVLGGIEDVWGEEQQENFVTGFQAVLKKISDAFDRFFDAIFTFLKLDEVLGRN